ncbi:MAG: hypothetical protein KDI98_04950, partial [Hyphomicrobiaceae bacterium]|nr:hypothetical protein [Hyphomicrobiaceae bacterium]
MFKRKLKDRLKGSVGSDSVTLGSLSRFQRAEGGNVALIFGLAMIPMIGLVAAAIDYSRVQEARSHALMAADAAALAGTRMLRFDDSVVEDTIRRYLDANLPPEYAGMPYTYEIDAERRTLRVNLHGQIDTTIMQVIGFRTIDWGVTSVATNESRYTEIALVLDVTGSMRRHMDALREAAGDFVDIIFDGQDNLTDGRVAIVPYRYTVNIGNGRTQMAWMDTSARSTFHGVNFEGISWYDHRCDPPPPPPPA